MDTLNRLTTTYWPSLDKPHLTLEDILPVIEHYQQTSDVCVEKIGQSYTGKPIHSMTIGRGETKVLAWTQMHGDEPTATAAIFDVIEHILQQTVLPLEAFLNTFTVRVIPMLNPDGAQAQTRINAQGIDINRDAIQLVSPEGQILRRMVEQFRPDVAFNLHDQNPYYTAGEGEHTSTIAYLAPAFDHSKSIDPIRQRAMQLIALMRQSVEQAIPKRVARYNDDYSFRSFGDTIAGLGASTILIESGAHRDDPNRAIARQMNILSLLTAFRGLAKQEWSHYAVEDYLDIPENIEDGLSDALITHVELHQHANGHAFRTDISIKGPKGARLFDAIGHLHHQHAFTTLDAKDLSIQTGRAFNVTQPLYLDTNAYMNLLRQGYSYFTGEQSLLDNQSPLPLLWLSDTAHRIQPKRPAFALLCDRQQPCTAILDGELYDLS